DEWLDGMARRFRAIEAAARALDPATLTTQEGISAGLLAHESRVWATDIEKRFSVALIDPFTGPHIGLLNGSRQNTVSDREQADMLLRRYEGIPEHLADALRLQRENAAAGITPPEAALIRVLSQLDGYLESSLDDDPFLKLQVPG